MKRRCNSRGLSAAVGGLWTTLGGHRLRFGSTRQSPRHHSGSLPGCRSPPFGMAPHLSEPVWSQAVASPFCPQTSAGTGRQDAAALEESIAHFRVTRKVVVVVYKRIYNYYDSGHFPLLVGNGPPRAGKERPPVNHRRSSLVGVDARIRRSRTSPGGPGTQAGCCPWGPSGSWPR